MSRTHEVPVWIRPELRERGLEPQDFCQAGRAWNSNTFSRALSCARVYVHVRGQTDCLSPSSDLPVHERALPP